MLVFNDVLELYSRVHKYLDNESFLCNVALIYYSAQIKHNVKYKDYF